MKLKIHYAAIALSFGLVGASQGAITFTLDQASSPNGGSAIFGSASTWDFSAGGPMANVYFDGNQNGIFGETATDTYGDTNAGLAANLDGMTITDGLTMNFAVEGFGGSSQTSTGFRFDITKTDGSTQTITAVTSGPVSFTDSNGDQWEVAYDFTAQGYGDVVKNLDSVPGGLVDHKAVLTFTSVPEPSSAALLGLGGLALLLRRRK